MKKLGELEESMQSRSLFYLKYILVAVIMVFGTRELALAGGKTQVPVSKKTKLTSSRAPQTGSEQANSTKVFRKFMNDPFLNHAYQAAQGSFLRTSPDQRMARFFDTNPLFQSPDVQEKLDAVMEQGVADSISTGLASMKRVTSLTDPKLYNRFAKVARRLGYSDEQIQNAYFFRAEGPVNAYTTSAFQDKIVVVLYDTLDNAMDERQEESVLGHEMGHILSRHVLRGAEHVAMTLQLGNLYAKNGNFGGFDDLNKLKNYEFYRHELQPYQQVFWDHVFAQYNLGGPEPLSWAQKDPNLYKGFKAMRNVRRDRFVDALQVMYDAAKGQPDLGAMAVVDYLKSMIISLSEMEVPQDTVDYYAGLLKNLPNAANDQKDGQQFTEYMMEGIANVGGKALESSADRYGQVVTDAYRASTTDLVFKGANLDPVSAGRPDLTRLQLIDQNIKETVDEWILLHNVNDPESFLEVMGRDPQKNHPLPVKRIIDMLVASRSVETLALSNPFLKSVILYDQLIKQSTLISRELDDVTSTLQSDEGKKLTVEQKRMVEKQIKEMKAYQEKSGAAAAQVAQTIMGLVQDPALAVNGPKTPGERTYQNPRLMDFLDFELARKQEEVGNYTEALKDAKSDEDKKAVGEIFDFESGLRDTPLLKSVRDYLEKSPAGKNLGKEVAAGSLEDVKLILKRDATSGEIQKARMAIAEETHSVNRRTRAPSDLTVVLQGTGNVTPAQEKESAKKDGTRPRKSGLENVPHGQDLASHFMQCELVLHGF